MQTFATISSLRIEFRTMAAGFGLCAFIGATPAFAHDPILSCFPNKDATVTCEAGYSDGAPSAGQTIRVLQTNKRLILEDKFGKNSSFTFKRPPAEFIVEFIGDSSHKASFDSEDLGP